MGCPLGQPAGDELTLVDQFFERGLASRRWTDCSRWAGVAGWFWRDCTTHRQSFLIYHYRVWDGSIVSIFISSWGNPTAMFKDVSLLPIEPRIAPILYESATPDQVERIEAADPALARLNLVRTTMKHQQLFDVSHPLGRHLLRSSSIPFRDRELLISRIAWLNASQYVYTQHVRVSRSGGMTDEEISGIKVGSQATIWSDRDRILLEAVEQLKFQNTINDATWEKLKSRYDEKQLIELIVLIGQYNTNSWLTNALRIQLEEGTVPQSMSR